MPPLQVEYAKSGRAKCSLTGCKKPIAKHEVRIGTVITLPFGDDGAESVKWRHLCCFTTRQLENARASGDIDNIQGYDTLAPSDQRLVDRMKKGELVGATEAIIGRIGDVANSPLAAELGAADAKPKKAAAKKAAEPKAKRAKKEDKSVAVGLEGEEEVDSDATDEFEVEVRAVAAKPVCPFGANCFRTAPEHFAQYSHDDGDGDGDDDGVSAATLRPVIAGKKQQRPHA